ncbi:Uncharacterised protein at_DN2400 [Pycnogonum litorale]
METADSGGEYLVSSTTKSDRDKRIFGCDQCNYRTDRKNNLKRHVATMHDVCNKSLECCDISFPNKADLKNHTRFFHKDGYSCKICGRTFCRKALLKRHQTIHNGMKEFTCTICDYATSHKSNLERHRKVHATSAVDDVSNDGIDTRNNIQQPCHYGCEKHMCVTRTIRHSSGRTPFVVPWWPYLGHGTRSFGAKNFRFNLFPNIDYPQPIYVSGNVARNGGGGGPSKRHDFTSIENLIKNNVGSDDRTQNDPSNDPGCGGNRSCSPSGSLKMRNPEVSCIRRPFVFDVTTDPRVDCDSGLYHHRNFY